jgi:hypothetical protein
MTYEESAALMKDFTFRGRVMVAALKFADSIMIETHTVPGHTSRLRWAQGCFQQPDMVAGQLQPPVVNDPAVQTAGADIEDIPLQAAVEGVVNKTV